MPKATMKETLELAKRAITALVIPMEALNIVYGDQYAPDTVEGIKEARKLAQEALPAIDEILGSLISGADPQ